MNHRQIANQLGVCSALTLAVSIAGVALSHPACPGAGDCCDPAGNGTPGCDDADCCNLICDGVDPYCCDYEWDGTCADEANSICAICALTIYVDDDNCPGPGSGTEADPYCSIQIAIENAADMDEIIVAPGTYLEGINFFGKAVTLRCTDPNDPDVVAATIIDGTGLSQVVQCVNGEGPSTVLDGFTITGANGAAPFGGGMYNYLSSPTVTNCTFSGNAADIDGGGMYNYSNSVTVTNCTFSDNTAGGNGGGMSNNASNPTVTGCTFSGNSADSDGGGMFNYFSGPTVTDCTFSGNHASIKGGGMFNYFSGATATNCTFSGNSTFAYGGGMGNASDGSMETTVASCTFSENVAVVAAGGVSIEEYADVYVLNCSFCGNYPSPLSGQARLGGHTRMNDFCPIPVCPGDTNGDGEVGVGDFLELLARWGTCP